MLMIYEILNLVQCSLSAIRHDHHMRTFYKRIKQRKGHGKAIVATAKKRNACYNMVHANKTPIVQIHQQEQIWAETGKSEEDCISIDN